MDYDESSAISSSEDSALLQRVFNINEEMDLPEDYQLDEINEVCMKFLKNSKNERKLIDSSRNLIKDIEFSSNIDNTKVFHDNYILFEIKEYWIENVKNEYFSTKNKINFLSNSVKLNFNDFVQKYRLQKEKIRGLILPTEDIINEINSILAVKLINHFHNLLKNGERIGIILLWIYSLLMLLDPPLVDDDSASLYSLNKTIVKELKKNIDKYSNEEIISMKIIFVILSEIFKQKIIH